jgi:hypothetical protein
MVDAAIRETGAVIEPIERAMPTIGPRTALLEMLETDS